MEKYRSLFIDKFSNNLRLLREELNRIDSPETQRQSIRRLFHNIKSDAAMMGYSRISTLAGNAEILMDDSTLENSLTSTLDMFDRFLEWLNQGKPGTEFA